MRTARHAIRAWLTDVGRSDLAEDAELAVSEIVTNALVHAGTSVEMTARLDTGFVRIEIADGNTHLPRTRDFDRSAGTGRGLKLLEQTVDRWGAELRGEGKVVWFELGDLTESSATPGLGDMADPAGVGAVRVQLSDVPLLLMAAWLEHVGELLREHLLVQLTEDNAGVVLARHAAASEVLSLLEEQTPALELGLAPDELMAGAVEPLVTAPLLVLTVPAESVPLFAMLDELVDDAVRMADEGLLLTPPTQPEVRALRRWITGEVRRQATGAPPQPRGAPSELDQRRTRSRWDVSSVDASATACIAADDSARIVAVSESALALLGHERDTLVGQRLLTIIPARFHQAHLAGVSLHLINGRGPLLGVPVMVPVLCRDGTERPLELTVTAQKLPQGRSVFLAEMRAV